MLGGYYLGQLYLGISGLPAAGILSVVPSSHQLSSDNITLTQKHTIVIADAIHGLTSGNITLTQKHVLTVDNAIHTLMSENVAITSEQVLGVNDAFHGLTSTEVQLTQKHTIVVENTTHTLTSSNLDLIEHKTLAVNNALHGHTAQNITLAVRSYLSVDNTSHSHTVQNIAITQKHYIVVANTLHGLTSDSLGGLINVQPDGFGGGFGAIEAWGVKHFGEINIELPLNYLILAQDTLHNLSSEELATFIQIFNMVRTGIYIKDFEDDGDVGSEYSEDAGTVPVKHGYFGSIAPVAESDNGFLIVKMGSSGSYSENDINSGMLISGNGKSGSLLAEDEDTGIYTKKENNNGEYEVI